MYEAIFDEMKELMRETFGGGLPGEGTRYLDHDSGIDSTLRSLTAEQASRSLDGHPSIAAHVRHMSFHLRVVSEWVQGVRVSRDWKGSFEPQQVTAEEWARLEEELEASRTEFLRAMRALPPETFVKEGSGMGAIAHLAYHLGAIRQLMHRV
jgi:hypothetical protein